MGRRILLFLIACSVAATACGGGAGRPARAPAVTLGVQGPLAAGLLTQTQLRQVPGLSTAKVTSLEDLSLFRDPDPRGPCGGKVPVLPLEDVDAVAIAADTIRGGAQVVARVSPGDAKRYLDARMADTVKGCPEHEVVTPQGVRQRVVLVRIVRLHREFEQALAVVTAVKVGESVRAATHIEVRVGDVLSRVVVFSNTPIANNSVRGIASIVGQNLLAFDE